MRKPKYKTIAEMEQFASKEADQACHIMLRRRSNGWLGVTCYAGPRDEFRYYHERGRKSKHITREEAQALLDKEHAD